MAQCVNNRLNAAFNGEFIMLRYVDYYGKSISEQGFEEALPHYLEYMEENKLQPEFTDEDWNLVSLEDLEETTISHVLYHAELHGFPVEEHMVD